MTLAEAMTICGDDPKAQAAVARCRHLLGAGVRSAVQARDGAALERAARIAGTYRVLVTAAAAAGVDYETLEEALGSI